jgi:hypothetical protein
MAEVSSKTRQDILKSIGERVTQLLGAARKDSESKVKAELKALNDIMQQMDARIDELIRQLDEIEQAPEQAVEPQTVAQALAKLEQQWGKELGKLKQELHQTIYAHNHNADLMKHQKDALDSIRGEIESNKSTISDGERIKQAKTALSKADAMLKGQQKQRKLEPLFRRLAAIEQRIATCRWPMGMMPGMAHPGMGMPPGMPGFGMPGGMPGMPGMPPGAQLAAAAAAAGRMPNPAAAAAAAAMYGGAGRGMMAGQADALAARNAAAAAMAAAAAGDRGAFAGMGDKNSPTSLSEEEEEEVDAGRPPGLL